MGWHGKEDGRSIWPEGTPLKTRLIWTFCFLLACAWILACAELLHWWWLLQMQPTAYHAPDWIKPLLIFGRN